MEGLLAHVMGVLAYLGRPRSAAFWDSNFAVSGTSIHASKLCAWAGLAREDGGRFLSGRPCGRRCLRQAEAVASHPGLADTSRRALQSLLSA